MRACWPWNPVYTLNSEWIQPVLKEEWGNRVGLSPLDKLTMTGQLGEGKKAVPEKVRYRR